MYIIDSLYVMKGMNHNKQNTPLLLLNDYAEVIRRRRVSILQGLLQTL